jgi:hypothetical protein
VLLAVQRHDAEGILREIRALRSLAFASLGRMAEAEAALDLSPTPSGTWPHIQVRTDLSVGRALRALGRGAEARTALLRALAASEANGFRTFQLLAHTELARTTADDATRELHQRVALGLARSLASNLRREDASRFLAVRLNAPVDATQPEPTEETDEDEGSHQGGPPIERH